MGDVRQQHAPRRQSYQLLTASRMSTIIHCRRHSEGEGQGKDHTVYMTIKALLEILVRNALRISDFRHSMVLGYLVDFQGSI